MLNESFSFGKEKSEKPSTQANLGEAFPLGVSYKSTSPSFWTLVTSRLNYCNSLQGMPSAREEEKSNLFRQGGVNPINLPAAFAILAAKQAIPHCL